MHGMPRNLVGTRHGWDQRTANTDAPPTSPHSLQSDTAGTTEPLPCKTRGRSDPARAHSQTVYAHGGPGVTSLSNYQTIYAHDLRCVTSLGTHTNWLRLTASWRSQFVRRGNCSGRIDCQAISAASGLPTGPCPRSRGRGYTRSSASARCRRADQLRSDTPNGR